MELDRSELDAIARGAGLRVMSSVSSKTAVLVVADPHSQSGKARGAREHGIRMVGEQVFLHMCENVLPAVPG
jgi:DNA polymerase-3 subunit epsilon